MNSANDSDSSVSASLAEALSRFQIALPAEQVEQLETYCRLLWAWNEKINLTRHLDFDTFVARDLTDALQLAAHIEPGEKVLDVGSGGGAPGVILAIVRPDLSVSLTESVQKKAAALEDIVSKLKLDAPVYHRRAESLLDDARFDAVTARAVGPIWKLLHWFKSSWPAIGRMLLVKGPRWLNERQEARQRGLLKDLELRKLATYQMPETDVESVILKIWPKGRG